MAKRKKQEVTILIDKVDYPNQAKGHIINPDRDFDWVDENLEIDKDYEKWNKGRSIIAKGGIEGQVWKALTQRNKGGAKEVKLLELIRRSPFEIESKCSVSNYCGGCNYQTLSYEVELLIKSQQLQRLYQQAGIKQPITLNRSPLVKGYRNKMEYTFGDAEKGGPLRLGLHRPGHFYEIVATPDCNIVPSDFNTIRQAVQEFCQGKELSFYHKAARSGYLRHLVIRASLATKELMINLVTTSSNDLGPEGLQQFVDFLLALDLDFQIKSIYHTTNDAIADAVIPEKLELLWGDEEITEKMCDLTFKVGPFSFFQPNVPGAENFYKRAIKMAGDLTGKTVYDLYSGTGTITQIMAKQAQRVIGVEIVEEAVEKAIQSAQLNEIANAKFICNDVLDELDKLAQSADKPDVIVLDPPREGINPKAISKIAATEAEKIVYISCNPRTQVQDLQAFQDLGYQVVEAEGFDQFSRTKHVEAVVLLVRV